LGLHERMDEAPPDRGVEQLRAALKSFRCLAHDERRPCHRLDAACDREIDFAAAYRPRGLADGVEAGGAQAMDRDARHAVRQTSQQQRRAGDVAVVLAGLVGAAVEYLIEGGPVCLWIAPDERTDRRRREIVGAHFGERAAIAADRRSYRIADEGIAHGTPLITPPPPSLLPPPLGGEGWGGGPLRESVPWSEAAP